MHTCTVVMLCNARKINAQDMGIQKVIEAMEIDAVPEFDREKDQPNET